MGKRRKEQPPDGKCPNPKTKRNLQEDLDVTGDDGSDMTGLAQTGDADGKPTSQGQTTRGSTGSTVTDTPGSANGAREAAAPERSRAGERVPSPSPQEGRDTGIGGGGKSPEVAAPGAASQPASPQRTNSVVEETEEDQPVATAERHRSTGEELDAETPTRRGTANIGDGPERGSAPPAWGEGAAGSEDAPPADTPGPGTGSCPPAEGPDPPREEGDDHGEPGERRGDANQSQELPRASVVNAEENESSTVSTRVAGGEHRENLSRERSRATGTNGAVESVAEPWCGPAGAAGGSVEILGVCALSADLKVEGGAAEPESVGAAGTAEPESVGAAGTAQPESVGTAGTAEPESWPQGENDSPWKTSGEADTGREAAGGGETPAPGTSSAPDPAVPAVGDPCGGSEGPAEEPGRTVSPRMDTQPPARPGTGSAVGTEPRGRAGGGGERLCPPSGLAGSSPELPPQQPLPAAARHDPVGPEPPAAAGRGDAAATGPRQPWPSGNILIFPPPFRREDATDIVCGLILELSNLNRLAMSAHRGLEALRRPKLRRSRRPALGPLPPRAGRWWKET
ncbi:unnamed protein product [Bubo scandiacus]